MDNKNFARRVTLLVLANLLVKLVWIFFIERKVQLNVGFQDFGFYYSVFSFTLILGVINDPGLNNYLIQYLSNGNTYPKHLAELFYLKTFLAVLFIAIGFIAGFLLGFRAYNLLGLLIIYQISFSFLNYLRGFLKGHQLINIEIFVSVLDKTLFIIAFLPALYFSTSFNWTINFYIIAQLAALSLSLIFCSYYLYHKRIRVFPIAKTNFNFSVLNKIAPFAIFAFLVLAYNKIDTIMLAKMLSNGNMQTGVYVAAYRFLDAASMLPILFATLFYPILCAIIGDRVKVNKLVHNSLSALIPLTIIMAMASWFYRFQLMDLLYHQNNSPQLSLIFGVLMLSLPLIVIYYVFSSVFTANNSLKLLNLISAGGLVVNVTLNFLLIPNYEALGAAISSFISFFLVGLTYVVFYYVRFKNPFKFQLWFKVLLFILLLIVFAYLLSFIELSWWLSFACFVFGAVIITAMLQFFHLRLVKDAIGLRR